MSRTVAPIHKGFPRFGHAPSSLASMHVAMKVTEEKEEGPCIAI
jgi:hypothetical protein